MLCVNTFEWEKQKFLLCLQMFLQTIDDKVKKEIADTVQQVTTAKLTDVKELTTDIYLVCYEEKIRDTVERNLEHKLVGKQYVPLGSPTPTPKSEIKDLPPPPPPPPPPASPPTEPAKKDAKDGKPSPSANGTATLPVDKSTPPPVIKSAPAQPVTPAKPKNAAEKSNLVKPTKEEV
ncbi:circumsporozoite protein-like [Glossina fuscipes]|uniref:Circumsporozoite protein-like n=1 Tax=Glossina fuscipes TaxID=7396 RepID=A0A9C6E1Y1_9MUSC|nr:circumsporozoite protein-like [Glossina fuscipes]